MLFNLTVLFSSTGHTVLPAPAFLGGAISSLDHPEKDSAERQSGGGPSLVAPRVCPSPPSPSLEKPRSFSRLTSTAMAAASATVGHEISQREFLWIRI